MRLRIVAFASIVVAAMGTASPTTPAQAQAAGGKDRHCVTDVSTPNTPTTCYDSFTTAIAKATGGRVTDAPDSARKAANDLRLQAQLNSLATDAGGKADPQTAGPIEIAWEEDDFGGDSLIFSTNRDCTATLDDIDFSVADLTSGLGEPFELRVYENYRGCASKHYEFPNFTGRWVGWDTGGVLPFPAQSIQWS